MQNAGRIGAPGGEGEKAQKEAEGSQAERHQYTK